MIFLYHIHNTVKTIVDDQNIPVSIQQEKPIQALLAIAKNYPEEWITWCHLDNKDILNTEVFSNLLHHKRRMISNGDASSPFLSPSIGYIEDSPFLKINTSATYPTWCMSSAVGAIHASVLIAIGNQITVTRGFDYFLNSLARKGQSSGLLCYHEPLLLRSDPKKSTLKKANLFEQYVFVKEHFKTSWLFFLCISQMRYEKKFPLIAFVYALLFVKRNTRNIYMMYLKIFLNKQYFLRKL